MPFFRRRRLWPFVLLPLIVVGMFEEPKPLAVWEDPVPSVSRPQTFRDKNYGQWCRNFTIDRHIQCPQGSPFHWYFCCGESQTECCAALQTWTVVVFGSAILSIFCVSLVSLLAYADLLWRTDSPKISKYATVATVAPGAILP